MTDTPQVRLDRDGGVVVITVDRPEARNSLTRALKDRLIELCGEVAADPAVRVTVFRGAGGRSFISGADIRELGSVPSVEAFLDLARQVEDLYAAIESIPVPTVAVIEGHALGSGFLTALACDLRVCTTDATFGVPAASKLGNCLAPGEYERLVGALGASRARELLLTAAVLDAERALSWGLVTEVVKAEELEPRVAELTSRLSSHAPLSMWAAKESIRRVVNGAPRELDVMRRVLGSEDFQEGMAAFAQKRAPQWRNR